MNPLPVGLTPDGGCLVGVALPADHQNYDTGLLEIATQQFTKFAQIPSTSGSNNAPLRVICCWTDGRYYVGDYTGPCDCQALWSYDSQTRKMTNLTTDERVVPSDGQPTISNGYLALEMGEGNPIHPIPGIEIYSLATHAIILSKPSSWTLSFQWPYLVYATITVNSSGNDEETGIHALDLQTNMDVALNTFLAKPGEVALSGDTVFLFDGTQLYELDHLMASGSQLVSLGGLVTGFDATIQMMSANARVILWKVTKMSTIGSYLLVWDRLEGHFVLLGSNTAIDTAPFFQAVLSGNYLLVTSANGGNLQATIYNTATLPVQ